MTLPGQLLANGSVLFVGTMFTEDQYRNMVLESLNPLGPPSIVLLVLYCLAFVLAAISNMLVIIVIYRFQHLRRSVGHLNDRFNYYIRFLVASQKESSSPKQSLISFNYCCRPCQLLSKIFHFMTEPVPQR